jgi:hypothetical protein
MIVAVKVAVFWIRKPNAAVRVAVGEPPPGRACFASVGAVVHNDVTVHSEHPHRGRISLLAPFSEERS